MALNVAERDKQDQPGKRKTSPHTIKRKPKVRGKNERIAAKHHRGKKRITKRK